MVGEGADNVGATVGSGSSNSKMPTLEEYGTNLTKLAEEVTYNPSFLNDRLLMTSHYVFKHAYFLSSLSSKIKILGKIGSCCG
jgi:hypothetical protein